MADIIVVQTRFFFDEMIVIGIPKQYIFLSEEDANEEFRKNNLEFGKFLIRTGNFLVKENSLGN